MTDKFDERMNRLTKRHEALAQTVEHIALHGEEQNRRIDKLLEITRHDGERIDKLLEIVRQDGENIRALARIAEIHEQRLTNLEG